MARVPAISEQPRRALPTAATNSLTLTLPSSSASSARQVSRRACANAMLTPLISSLTDTAPLWSQSPAQRLARVGEGEAVGLAVGVGVTNSQVLPSWLQRSLASHRCMQQIWPASSQAPEAHSEPRVHGCPSGVDPVQVPSCPGASQRPFEQVSVQQKLSTQKPERHWSGRSHGFPGFAGAVHTPGVGGMSQRAPVGQAPAMQHT